jgi:hypothetical protein
MSHAPHAIVKALYHTTDVTARLRQIAGAQPRLDIAPGRLNGLFGDVAPNVPKTLHVDVASGQHYAFAESERVAIDFSAPFTRAPTDVMTKTELQAVLSAAGIVYNIKYRCYDQCPVRAVNAFCRANNKVFVDPYFPYDDAVSDVPPGRLAWRRPRDIDARMAIFPPSGACVAEDMCQGGIGNCGVTAMANGLQALPAQPLRRRLFPLELNPYGCYSLRVFEQGCLDRYVLFDDLFPTDAANGNIWSWQDHARRVAWPMFLEKALATRSHDYDPWNKGRQGSAERWTLRYWDYGEGVFHVEERCGTASDADWATLERHVGRDSIAAFAWGGQRPDADAVALQRVGLVAAHGYSLLKVASVGGRKFLRCRNPWGTGEWTGDWCASSGKWREHPEVAAALLPAPGASGAFWITREDFWRWATLNERFRLIISATPCAGYQLDVWRGVVDPTLCGPGDDARQRSPTVAVHFCDAGEMVLFNGEALDSRMARDTAEDNLRIFFEIFEATGKASDGTWTVDPARPIMTTRASELENQNRDPPHHRVTLPHSGTFLFVARPLCGRLPPGSTRFFLRVASRGAFTRLDGPNRHHEPPARSTADAFTPFPVLATNAPRAHPVFRATYHATDVTAKLRKIARASDLRLDIAPGQLNNIFGDVAPGVPKRLVIQLVNGDKWSFGEGERVALDIPQAQTAPQTLPKRHWVISAEYGGSLCETNLDVDGVLRGLVAAFGHELLQQDTFARAQWNDVFGCPGPGLKQLRVGLADGSTLAADENAAQSVATIVAAYLR